MRVPNDSYSRELRSFELALRMLSQEARTHTISLWARLSPERVRQLAILQRREANHRKLPRHRGPSPTSLAGVLTSPSLRREAAVLAGFCRFLRVIPDEPQRNAVATLPSLGRGERLCSAIELFQILEPHGRISLDQLVLMVVTLAEGAEWGIDGCERCATLIVVDRLSFERAVCEDCERKRERRRSREREDPTVQEEAYPADRRKVVSEGEQLDLFLDSHPSDDSG